MASDLKHVYTLEIGIGGHVAHNKPMSPPGAAVKRMKHFRRGIWPTATVCMGGVVASRFGEKKMQFLLQHDRSRSRRVPIIYMLFNGCNLFYWWDAQNCNMIAYFINFLRFQMSGNISAGHNSSSIA